jgi:hypothetical protein
MFCGEQTQRGNRCKNRTWNDWQPDWPEQQSPGRCIVHLSNKDKETIRIWRAKDAPERGSIELEEPACWSWPVLKSDVNQTQKESESRTPEAILSDWQHGLCAICGNKQDLVIDHDHDTGLIRGLLCHSCNVSESGERWDYYRERNPAKMLGLKASYWDVKLGVYAPNLSEFRRSISGICSEPCFRCGMAKGDPCTCPPFYRLDPRKLFGGIAGLVVSSAGLRVNDLKHTIKCYLRTADIAGSSNYDASLEDEFLWDLVLLPRNDYIAGKWFGGKSQAAGAIYKAQQGESYSFLQCEDDGSIATVPAQLASRVIAAICQAGVISLFNKSQPIQYTCFQIASEIGLSLSDAETTNVQIPVYTLHSASRILHWIADRVTSHDWVGENAETTRQLPKAFLRDADYIDQVLSRAERSDGSSG